MFLPLTYVILYSTEFLVVKRLPAEKLVLLLPMHWKLVFQLRFDTAVNLVFTCSSKTQNPLRQRKFRFIHGRTN